MEQKMEVSDSFFTVTDFNTQGYCLMLRTGRTDDQNQGSNKLKQAVADCC